MQYINLGEDQSAEIRVDITAGSNTEVVLVVSALNRFTRIPTRYEFSTR